MQILYETYQLPIDDRGWYHGRPDAVTVGSHPDDEAKEGDGDGPLVGDRANHQRRHEDARQNQRHVTDTRADGAHSCAIYMYMTRVHGETT